MKRYFWTRFYTHVLENNKLNGLAFEDRWHFLMIYCLKQQGFLDDQQPDTGLHGLNQQIAQQLGLQVTELDKVKYRLIESGLIDSEWNPSIVV